MLEITIEEANPRGKVLDMNWKTAMWICSDSRG